MRQLKRDMWKVGITIASMLLLLVLIMWVWVPVSAAGRQERASGLTKLGAITVQATPTEDATVIALNKEKLAQEVQQLKNQNNPDPLSWLRTNASILLSTLVVVVGALVGLFRWLADRRDEQEKRREDQRIEQRKRDEERFQTVITGLGNTGTEAKVGFVVMLRTFLGKGYEQFYSQTFDLAVAHLRLPRTITPPEDPDKPLPLTTLSRALIVIFKEVFPLARQQNAKSAQTLDATGVQLDKAYLDEADLNQIWMPYASLRESHLHGAYLNGANLRKANLREANLSKAHLSEADLSGTDLRGTYFKEADLRRANLGYALPHKVNLRGADLSYADLREANLRKANLEEAKSLHETDLRGVKGLNKEQLEACKTQGAIIDEDVMVNISQSTVSPSPTWQNNDI